MLCGWFFLKKPKNWEDPPAPRIKKKKKKSKLLREGNCHALQKYNDVHSGEKKKLQLLRGRCGGGVFTPRESKTRNQKMLRRGKGLADQAKALPPPGKAKSYTGGVSVLGKPHLANRGKE